MTFLELQNMIIQTRKARRGVSNREDYFSDDPNEAYWGEVYKKALRAANEVIKHYTEVGEISPRDKLRVSFGEEQVSHHQSSCTYDPKKHYLVSRKKAGRPKHIITPREKSEIKKLREKGMSINAISKALSINNRQIMDFCRTL